jgi:hypothetical protein
MYHHICRIQPDIESVAGCAVVLSIIVLKNFLIEYVQKVSALQMLTAIADTFFFVCHNRIIKSDGKKLPQVSGSYPI